MEKMAKEVRKTHLSGLKIEMKSKILKMINFSPP